MKSVDRAKNTILRCYNVTFKHALLCNEIFGPKPKLEKFYGIYYHSLTTRLPEVNRIIAPSSLFTESEERIFSSLRGIGKSTSSRTPDSIRDVGIVRYEILTFVTGMKSPLNQ